LVEIGLLRVLQSTEFGLLKRLYGLIGLLLMLFT